MNGVKTRVFIEPIMGDEVALGVLNCIGSFRQLQEAFITTYTLQDYDFLGHGLLSTLLSRQITYGAKITMVTSPPEGKPHKSKFKSKLSLLEQLDRFGVDIQLHENLHAKVFLFLDSRQVKTTIVGSANLTHRAFGVRGHPKGNLLELALITNDPGLYHQTLSKVDTKIIKEKDTVDFNTWRIKNSSKIAIAKGGGSI
jgi:phosphatidylserine/phosphatidylglycerophosphate/cardiolipin synthase-like enzyme